jgi:hypothetical protein
VSWLKEQEVVTDVSFTARLPNPEPRDAFRDLAQRLEARRARSHTETMIGDKESGLTGIEDDRDFKQAIAMGEQGFATLRGTARTHGATRRFNQKTRVATDHEPELPADWPGILMLIKHALKTRFRRYIEESDAGP